MSYVRFGQDDSDVYVFLAGGTQVALLVCCGCGINNDKVWAPSTAVMVAHLREHIAKGDHVPDYVIPNLETDDVLNFPPEQRE